MHKCINYVKNLMYPDADLIFLDQYEIVFASMILKSCNKIYYLKRDEKEVRVNDYNPLLLKLWRANMDLQYIAEKSLYKNQIIIIMYLIILLHATRIKTNDVTQIEYTKTQLSFRAYYTCIVHNM